MNKRYQLREAAVADLEEIWRYTFETWSADQADDYVRALLMRCQWLMENPQLGKSRDDIRSGYYCFPEGMHLVFYKIIPSGIDVLGFPHQSMDVLKYFT